MKKRILALVLVLALAVSMVACGSAGNEATPTAPVNDNPEVLDDNKVNASAGEVKEAEDVVANFVLDSQMTIDQSRPNTTNTDGRYDTFASAITMAINDLAPFKGGPGKVLLTCELYETLFDQVGLNDYEGRLAKEDKWIDDLHYEVTIYDYIYDHEGNHVTASDVAYTYAQYKDSGFLQDANYLETVEATGDYTVLFTFTKPLDGVATYANLFSKPYIFTEKAYTEHNFATDPVGTGPYYLSDFVAGSHVTVSVFENYWQTEELRSEWAGQNVEHIRVDTLGDDSLCELAVTTGDNGLQRVDSSSVNKYLEGGEYYGLANLYLNPVPAYHGILPNCHESNLFSDINARLALFYAIDLNTFVKGAGSITFQPSKVYCHNSATDYDPSFDAIAEGTYQTVYDVELAKEYLAKTGYKGETLKILTMTDSSKTTMAQILMGQLQAIGVYTEIVALEDSLFDATLSDPTAWDIVMAGDSSRPYTINGLMSEFSAAFNNGTTKNYVDDAKFQDMLAHAYTAEGFTTENIGAIMQYIIDNAYAIGTVSSVDVYAYSPAVAFCYKTYSGSWMFGSSEYYLDID